MGSSLAGPVLRSAALVPTAIAGAVIVVASVRALGAPAGRRGHALGEGLRLAVEFLLAAGLLRLATVPDLQSLGLAALIVVVRRVVGAGVHFAERALEPGRESEGEGAKA